ncbi:Caudovirales tail fiber assembly protein [Serratia sp. FGI94]|uniref:tail fiber assembly protein n=1 Tax=Serratia sp. FGI94 TaxID=671990 RepID=UPI0002A71BBA|nr:tail fiber assembly protein [Serratia sp. FGI94]AGB81165.1 Caudovirales tail fiber assembly protein [Serratia sp. FGI94]
MAKAKLTKKLIATTAGDITVFNYSGDTREYLSSSVEYLAAGVGLPANSCIDAPGDKKDGYAICRTADLLAWEYLPDHRGETIYGTLTREPQLMTTIGDYPPDTTPVAPRSPYDKWKGKKWVTDSAAERDGDITAAEQQRQTLLAHADAIITDWRVELMLGDISAGNKTKLSKWMAYKKAVKAVDVSTAPDISWPAQPKL